MLLQIPKILQHTGSLLLNYFPYFMEHPGLSCLNEILGFSAELRKNYDWELVYLSGQETAEVNSSIVQIFTLKVLCSLRVQLKTVFEKLAPKMRYLQLYGNFI